MTPSDNAYKKAGVDIDKGNALVEAIKPYVKQTHRPEVLSHLGHFAGLFQLDLSRYRNPVLASSTDGVGTKLKLAQQLHSFASLGQDLVAMNANDLACVGAVPLFFLDYYATGVLDVPTAQSVIQGIAAACQTIGCALIGGETAEMPSVYAPQDFDLAGFIVGVVEKDKICDGSRIRPGQVTIGLPASGFHSNGYSLVRHLVETLKLDLHASLPGSSESLGQALLKPTPLYGPTVLPIHQDHDVFGMAHITGGGLIDNITRLLNPQCRVLLHRDAWHQPPVMTWLCQQGNMDRAEQHRVFNCGIGYVLFVGAKEAQTILKKLQMTYPEAAVIGEVVSRNAGQAALEVL